MNKVRMGLIGAGGIGNLHMSYFEKVEGLEFTAVADIDPDAMQAAVEKYGVEGFDTGQALIDSGKCDAVLISTPHYDHPVLAQAAMKANLHVLTEKPVAVTAKAAAETNALAKRKKKLVYGAMFQMRTARTWAKVKQLVEDGEIGEMKRMSWIVTSWFRTQAYYDSGGWRATWDGEGGGVLLNQCPHNLDMLCWVCGTPTRVIAQIALGKYHKIEVEDDVTAYLEFKNGATGLFVTTTGEAPGTDRFEIAGDRGRLVVEGGAIEIIKTDLPVSDFCKNSEERFAKPPTSRMTVDPGKGGNSHQMITQNFVNTILKSEELLAPATEGLHGLELSNAMIMSGLENKPIEIPTPRDKYEQLIRKLARQSKPKKTKPRKKKTKKDDMGSSFH